MTAYNFPNSPSDGDTETANGITYTYSSSKTRWDAAAPSGSSTTVYATIDLLPLSGASTGDQAYVSGNNRLYIWNGTGWYNIALINTTPSISGVNGSYTLATDGTPTTVTITATDPEGIPITYSIASDTSGNVATVAQGTGSNTNVFTITPSTNTANVGTFSLTFRASDGVNIATAVSSFTLIFGIENSNYTTALITSVGANNAVNNSFDDASTNNHTITANGNVTQNTFSPYRHGGYSTYFDGSGDQIDTPTDASLTVGAGQFTIECWFQVHQDTQQTIFSLLNGTTNVVNVFYWHEYNNIGVTAPSISTYGSSNSNTVDLHKWHHLSLVRNSSTMFLYVDGSLMWASNNNDNINSNRVRIAANQYGNYLLGYVSDLRFVIGTAIYPASGGPTERLTATTNTSLLTCHLPYIADGSTNNHSITVNGNTKPEPLSPYDHNGYSSGANGGSMYFDGNGDYLTVPNDTSLDLHSSSFTIEFWAYSSNPNSGWPLAKGDASTATGSSISWYWGGGFTEFYASGNGIRLAHGSIFPENKWFHVACCRSGSDFTFYLNGTSVATATSFGAINTTTSDMWVGAYPAAGMWQGSIADFRFVKGTAVYTSAFTPPTAPLTAITNTSLLLNGTGAGIIDKSQSVKAVTLDGSAKSSTAQTKYLTSSMSFAAQTDFLKVELPDTIGTGDFTIEWWAYFTNINAGGTNYRAILDMRHSGDTTNMWLQQSGDGSWSYYPNYPTTGFTSSTFSNNTWYHIAIARENGTIRFYVDGSLTGSGSDSYDYNSVFLTLNHYSSSSRRWTGYASDLRVTKGLARYTAADETANIPSAALEG